MDKFNLASLKYIQTFEDQKTSFLLQLNFDRFKPLKQPQRFEISPISKLNQLTCCPLHNSAAFGFCLAGPADRWDRSRLAAGCCHGDASV